MRRAASRLHWQGIGVLAVLALALGILAPLLLYSGVRSDAPVFNAYAVLEDISDTEHLANADLFSKFGVEHDPWPTLHYDVQVSFTPPEWGVAQGEDVPIGAFVGTLDAVTSVGIFSNPCGSFYLTPHFDLMNCTLDKSDTVDYLGQFNNMTTVADGCTKWPAFLDELFPGMTPIARMGDYIRYQGGINMSMNILIFEPGTSLPAGFNAPPFPADKGYVAVSILQNPAGPMVPNLITNMCPPLESNTKHYGYTKDNPRTSGVDEAWYTWRTNPQFSGTYTFYDYTASIRDADADNLDNALDPCPHIYTTIDQCDPTDLNYPGDTDKDGLCDACDPTPNGKDLDPDGDGFPNFQDNCPLVANPDQLDSDLDSIGDACDQDDWNGDGDITDPGEPTGFSPNTPNGQRMEFWFPTEWEITGAAGSDWFYLVHVSPDGTDYMGNPYCPDTMWVGGEPTVNPWHDCNNITGQYHVIRTVGWDTGYSVQSWNVENFSGAGATIQAQGRCGDIAEVTTRPNWDATDNDDQCVVIDSSTPGETRVTLTYSESSVIYTTSPVVKEWDTLVDSVILKPQMGDLVKVKVYFDVDGDTIVESWEYRELYLPPDVNDDGVRDAADEHLLDKQGAWQDHAAVFDEALKRIRSVPPVQITEVVHGEHDMLINGQTVTLHQPTEGAIVTATIESPRFCTFFTNATGSVNYGATVSGVSDNLGRLVVYVDTICEEQATLNFHSDYPPGVGSLPLPVDEWVGINWTTIELAKQPQIRWAGEEIILARRWALLNDWYPNATCGDGDDPCPYCPLATIGGAVYSDEDGDPDGLMDTVLTHHARYNLLGPNVGALEGGYIDTNRDGVLDTLSVGDPSWAVGDIDDQCISKALAGSEDLGQQDTEALLMEDTYYCPQSGPPYGEIYWDSIEGAWWCDYDAFYAPADLQSSLLVNKHAWLVWYLKVYQVKLTNVDGERELHNDGNWNQGGGADTEEDTLNVSADTLLRVKVKGWFYNSYHSGRGDVCIDMDGDGDEEGSEKGAPYPALSGGCPDAADEMLENGYWVLPDDLPLLAGPDPIHTRPSWDVMSEPDAAKTAAIGPKSTLDSHDAIVRPWLGRKTVVPDGAITAADAIMPPLKIRVSIASGDAGFLKEAPKGVVYPGTNDYHSVMIPADAEIPAIVGNGGYDWSSWTMPSCPDNDLDGVCNAVDKCPNHFDPTNGDLDGDGTGDVCDADADGDTILDDGDGSGVIGDAPCINGDTTDCDDNCRLKYNATQADIDADGIGDACDAYPAVAGTPATDLDSDFDTVLDINDNCPSKSNYTQLDTDRDGVGDACDSNPGLPWWQTPPVPYPFWTTLNELGAPYPYYIELYTDNRGEGMFFANGDYNLSYDECRTDPISGAPDCRRDNVVGNSTISVIGDYPYFRRHPAVLSNPVVKTWTWGGFNAATAQQVDATHTAIVAHLEDRDGYCNWDIDIDGDIDAIFSPSEHPVQGEQIEFILNTEVGTIIDVSPNALYSAPHTPLGEATVTGTGDGVIVNRSEAVALAEDARVLDGMKLLGMAGTGSRAPIEQDECQAWIIVEHAADENLDVSVRFHDPEGVILRHWSRPCSPPDSDCDDFGDSVEAYVGTDPLAACPLVVSSHDAWPLDINMDTYVTVVGDVLNYSGRIGATGGPPPSANWWGRLDLSKDNFLTVVGDVLKFSGKVGTSCT